MLKEEVKNSLIINNAIDLGADISDEKNGKGRSFTSRFIESGLAHYQEFGDVLITKETLDKFIHTMVGCPVIIKHKDITDKNVDKERVGVISEVWYNPQDGWYYCKGIIWDKQAISLVKDNGWSVSCTYDFESDFKKGTYHGKEYDMEFINGNFLHLALVPNPRYEKATIVVNAKDEEMQVENDRWITIGADEEEGKKGRHILVKDGETNKEATERKVKEWEEKGETKDKQSETPKEEKGESNTKEKDIQDYLEGKISPDELEKKQPNISDKEWHSLAKERMDKKYGKQSPETSKEEKTEAKKSDTTDTTSPFGEGVEIKEHDKKGYMLDSKNLKSYRKGDKFAVVDDWSHDDKSRFTVRFSNKTSKSYSTEKGMQKAIREYLNAGENKETKALETKTDLPTAEATYKDIKKKYDYASSKRWQSGISNKEYAEAWADAEKYKKQLTKARREYAEAIMSNFEFKEDTYKGSKAGISADDVNAIGKLAQKYKRGVDSAEKRRIIDRVIDIHKNKTAQTNRPASETSKHGFQIERNTDLNRLQLKFDGKPDADTRSILKSHGFRWSPTQGAWQRQLGGNAEYSLKMIQEKLDKKVNNSKGDLIMTVFEDLENFIKGIVANAVDEEEREEEFEEEKEIAENKKAKNEELEEEKEEKEEVKEKEVKNKKAKNEDKEDEEEDEDDEKDEKAENKCKNSMDDVKKAVFGGKSQAKTYVSRADRIELGNNY